MHRLNHSFGRCKSMNVSILAPADTTDLTRSLAEFHSSCILRQIRELPIPAEQKLTLLSAVIDQLSGPP